MTLGKIQDYVRGKSGDMLRDLQRLVDLDSPTYDREASNQVANELQAMLRDADLMVERIDTTRISAQKEPVGDHLVARLPSQNGDKKHRALLVGHYDTVFSRGAVKERPFRVEEGKAFGPGIFDMKGGLIVALYAVRCLMSLGLADKLGLTIFLNSDEEDGSWRSKDLIVDEARKHDSVLVFEPNDSGKNLILNRKGGGRFRIHVSGREAHAGMAPEQGRNAILEMAHKTLDLVGLADPKTGTTVSPGVISGGRLPAVIPAECELQYDIRVLTAEEADRVLSGIDAIAKRTYIGGTSTKAEGSFHRPPMVASAKSLWLLRMLEDVGQKAGEPISDGKDGSTGGKFSGGASDANLTSAVGIATIDGLGPYGYGAHGPNEYIEVEGLQHRCVLVAGFLATLAGADL